MTPANYILVTRLLGVLFLLDLVMFTPYFRMWFGRAYHQGSPIAGRFSAGVAWVVWATACIGLILGAHILLSSTLLVLFFRYFYIDGRWKSLLRGAGAVGYMPYHAALFVCLTELALLVDPSRQMAADVFMVYRLDLAMILICSGVYKCLAGYAHNDGFEYALVNPMWCHFFGFFRLLRPSNPFFLINNYAAFVGEIMAGLFLLSPAWCATGAILCAGIFLYIFLLIRLGTLPLLMVVVSLFFMPNLGLSNAERLRGAVALIPDPALAAFHALCVAYLVTVALIKMMQYAHLFFGKRFPFDQIVERIANAVPVIMWRVFTADLTNFFVRITRDDTVNVEVVVHETSTYSYVRWSDFGLKWRYLHPAESVVLASTFSLLKYFKSNPSLFHQKLLRYARTVPGKGMLRFEYVSIRKSANEFLYTPVSIFIVDRAAGTVREERISMDSECSARSSHSPIHESAGYGSYAKKQEI